ncbi:MAG: DUF2442 domain-containing protein [Clostridia bacterium]
MKIINGIAYANSSVEILEVSSIKVLDDMIMIVIFNNGEEKIFDATVLLDKPVFAVLKDVQTFKSCEIVGGIITWLDGDLDLSTQMLYDLSFKYSRLEVV